MPLITRRSSTRSTPRTSVGRWGSIRFHCSSLSQNRFLRTIPPLPKTNQDRIVRTEKLMSSDPSRRGASRRWIGHVPLLGNWEGRPERSGLVATKAISGRKKQRPFVKFGSWLHVHPRYELGD